MATPATSEPPPLSVVPSHLRDVLRLAIPAMLAIGSEPLLNIADTAMIGRLGVEPLGARAIGSSLIGAVYWGFTFLAFGTTTLVGYHHGEKNDQACGETWLHAAALALAGGTIVALLGIYFAADLYRWMGAEQTVAEQGAAYFRIRIAGAPFTFLFFATVGLLRGVQNTRTPMEIAFLVNGANLLLDIGLIYGGFGLPALGLIGAAAAAWIAQAIGALACVGVFFFSRHTAPYRLRSWRLRLSQMLPLFRIGRDLAVRTGSLRFSLVFATGTAARMGATTLSAHEIAFQLLMLCSDVIDGLAVAGQALAAKYLGARHGHEAHRMGRVLILCGAVAGLLFTVGFISAEQSIIHLFTTSPDVILVIGGGLFLLVALFQPLNGIVFVLDGLLIGAHDTCFLMRAMLVGALGIFVPISWLSLELGWGLNGVWAGVSALMAWRFAANFYRFVGKKWLAAGR